MSILTFGNFPIYLATNRTYTSVRRYYTTISSAEQRRRYKAEFNADYEEYRRLHAQVAKVSKRFAQLQERLKQEEASGNWDEYEVRRNYSDTTYLFRNKSL